MYITPHERCPLFRPVNVDALFIPFGLTILAVTGLLVIVYARELFSPPVSSA